MGASGERRWASPGCARAIGVAGALGRSARQQRFQLALHLFHAAGVAHKRRLAVPLLQLVPLAAQAEAVPLL